MLRNLLVAVTALTLTTGAAYATVVSGTGSFTDLGSTHRNQLTFSASSNTFSYDLVVGTPTREDDFFSINETDTSGGTATDNLEATFSFTEPTGSTGSISGSGTGKEFSFIGTFIDGAITWDNPATVNFSDGAQLNISLADISTGYTFGSQQTIGDDATFTLIKAPTPTPVPEPGSLALLGTGLLGLGLTMRRRNVMKRDV